VTNVRGGAQVSVHELLRPGEEYAPPKGKGEAGADDELESDEEKEEEEEEEEEEEALASAATRQALVVPGLEAEVGWIGRRVPCKLWDHRNGTYTCQFVPQRVGRLRIEVALLTGGGVGEREAEGGGERDRDGAGGGGSGGARTTSTTEALRGSPFYPLVSSIPEWGVHEVTTRERKGERERARARVRQRARGVVAGMGGREESVERERGRSGPHTPTANAKPLTLNPKRD
jgi:hypothetical protein